MKITGMLLFIVLVTTSGFSQKDQAVQELHIDLANCPISLKGGYQLTKDTVETRRVVKLTSANGDSYDIVSSSLKASENSMGWVQFDTDSLFVIAGSVNDTCITIYNKLNGKKMGYGGFLKFDASIMLLLLETGMVIQVSRSGF
jgi:hypothetical protein